MLLLPRTLSVEFCYSLGFGTTGDSGCFLVIVSIQTVVIWFARVPHSPTVLLTFVFCICRAYFNHIEQVTLALHSYPGKTISITVVAKGAAFTAKMNAGFDDDEFTAVDVESRGSELNKQSNDPPEFTGTKPSEFKSYRKKVKTVASFHANQYKTKRSP